MKILQASLAVAAVLALASCGKGPATPSTPGCLSGTVLDSLNGVPLAGAKVVAGGTDSTWSDADGKFLLSLLQGRYAVQVSRDGFYGVAANVPILSRDTTRVTINTRPRAWLPGTAMPEARHHFGVASVLNETFVIAGLGVAGGGVTRFSSLLSFLPSSSLWTTSGLTPISVHRELPACAVMGSDIYVFGGSVGTGDTALCQEYSTLLNSWANRTPPPDAFRAAVAVTVGDSIFVFGGFSGGNTATSLARVYKSSADTAGGAPWSNAAPMPTALGGMSCAVHGGNIFVFGGSNNGVSSPQVFSYNPAADAWTARANMPAERAYTACAAVGSDIYVFGGLAGSAVCSSTYRYNPAANTWTVMEPMPLARYGAGAVAFGNRIYVFGGFDGTNSMGIVEVYNPAADVK